MKTMLLLGGSMLLLFSCVDSPNQDSTENLSDEEMKNRVEVEEIEFDEGLNDFQLKDSMKSEDFTDEGNERNSSDLGKMLNEVPREFPQPKVHLMEHDENAHVNIPPPSDRLKKPVRMTCIPPLSPSDLTQVPDEYGVHDFPDSEAQYPGGVQEMKTFIMKNLMYPDPIGCYQGRVYVTFIVEKDGCVTHAEVMRGGISKELNEEALRVVRSMPQWIPAKHNGKVVAARLRMPVSFSLN